MRVSSLKQFKRAGRLLALTAGLSGFFFGLILWQTAPALADIKTSTSAKPLATSAEISPFLALCVGVTIAADCSTTEGTSVVLGNLSSAAAKAGTSQFAAQTNDFNGYSVAVLGTTMTS